MSVKKVHFVFVLLLMVVGSCTKEVDLEEPTIVYGAVTSAENGQPISGAVVKVGITDEYFDTTVVSSTLTNADGCYSLKFGEGEAHMAYKKANRRWSLWFSKGGFATLSTSVKVSSITEYNLNLMEP